jgi:hypothetical protein
MEVQKVRRPLLGTKKFYKVLIKQPHDLLLPTQAHFLLHKYPVFATQFI